MHFLHIATAILVALKIAGYIAISWWLVLAPSLVVVALALVVLVIALATMFRIG